MPPEFPGVLPGNFTRNFSVLHTLKNVKVYFNMIKKLLKEKLMEKTEYGSLFLK